MNTTTIRVLAAAAALSLPIAIAGAATASPATPQRHFAPSATASAAAGAPTVHEQQLLSQARPIAANGVHTTLVTSPVLAPGSYVVNLVLDLDNVQPGSTVLRGDGTTTNFDVVNGNYGIFAVPSGTSAISGTCAVTSTIQITQPNDHVILWATVYSGPAGATAGGWSMNETPVGRLVVTH